MSVGIAAAMLLAVYFRAGIYFESNDDRNITEILSGTTGCAYGICKLLAVCAFVRFIPDYAADPVVWSDAFTVSHDVLCIDP